MCPHFRARVTVAIIERARPFQRDFRSIVITIEKLLVFFI